MDFKIFATVLIGFGAMIITCAIAVPSSDALKAYRKFKVNFNNNCNNEKCIGNPVVFFNKKISILLIIVGLLLIVFGYIILIIINDIIYFIFDDILVGSSFIFLFFILLFLIIWVFNMYNRKLIVYDNALKIDSFLSKKCYYFSSLDRVELKNFKVRGGYVYSAYVLIKANNIIKKIWIKHYKNLIVLENCFIVGNPCIKNIVKEILPPPKSYADDWDEEDRY